MTLFLDFFCFVVRSSRVSLTRTQAVTVNNYNAMHLNRTKLNQSRHNNVHSWPELCFPRVVRDFTLKRLCMLRTLSSTTGIGPRAAKQAPFLYRPLPFMRMNMEQERTSEHRSAIDISTWRRSTLPTHTHTHTHTHTCTEYSRGNKSINTLLPWRTHVEVVRALVLDDVIIKES